MIELRNDALVFSFPEVHAEARLSIGFQRTLRIPDDDKTYPLPPGLGRFLLRHVDDFAANVPAGWREHGGVMLPMYQSEAMWLCFNAHRRDGRGSAYPFAIKVAAGKINAVSGQPWNTGLHQQPQDYVVAPEQSWLDGFCVSKGVIRQFVAMPLGAGYSAEEQITGDAQHGGLQIEVYPMKADAFERRFPRSSRWIRRRMPGVACCMHAMLADMALAPGGTMKQEIYNDPFDLSDWDLSHSSRCFVHLANSLVWESITGHKPPTTPPTAAQYTRAGLPWFDYYSETSTAVDGSPILSNLKSIFTRGKAKGDVPLPENEPVRVSNIVALRRDLKPDQVREGAF